MIYGPISRSDCYYLAHPYHYRPDTLELFRQILVGQGPIDQAQTLAPDINEAWNLDVYLYMNLYKRNRPKTGLGRIAIYDKVKAAIEGFEDDRLSISSTRVGADHLTAVFYIKDICMYTKASISVNRKPKNARLDSLLAKYIRFWYTLLLWKPKRFYKFVEAYRFIEGRG